MGEREKTGLTANNEALLESLQRKGTTLARERYRLRRQPNF